MIPQGRRSACGGDRGDARGNLRLMDRKLIRPSLTRPPGSGPRRPPPPGHHAESGYLQQAVDARGVFVVQLLGGEELRGRLEAHDHDAFVMGTDERALQVVRKDKVRCYWLERAPPA